MGGTGSQPLAEKWCKTQSNVYKLSYLWSIENFSFRSEQNGQVITSSEFSVGHNEESKWCLKMYPKGEKPEYKEYISIFLYLLSSSNSKIMCKLEFSILNDKQEKKCTLHSKGAQPVNREEGMGFTKFVRQDDLLKEGNCLLPADKLTIFCEISIVGDSVNVPGPVQFKYPENKLSKGFENRFHNHKVSDVTFVSAAGGLEFQAHKAILAAQSHVFAGIFDQNSENKIEIRDVPDEVFEEMLNFIYTGKAPRLEEMTKDLLDAAEKYKLEDLRVMCEEALFSQLSVEKRLIL